MATRVHYSGYVQGVGFRATARAIALRHPGVRGWVRNLSDGRVELLVDGTPDAVTAFLADLRDSMTGYIDNEERAEQEVSEPLDGFRIRY